MLASLVFLWVMVLINLLLSFGLIRKLKNSSFNRQPLEIDKLEEKSLSPDFNVFSVQGGSFSNKNLIGKRTALIFLSASCASCLEIIPRLENSSEKLLSAGIQVLIANDGSEVETRGLVKKYNITLPVLIAPRLDNPFFSNFKIIGTPYFYLIGKNGGIEKSGLLSLISDPWKTITDSLKT